MEDSLGVSWAKSDAGAVAFHIRCLERSAYAAVLRAFCAQSYFFSRAREERLAEVRSELKISDTEHRIYLVEARSNKLIQSLSADLYKTNIGNTEVMKGSPDLECLIPNAKDTAFQIHCLERSAYAFVLRAFCAQSDLLSSLHVKPKLLTKLRYELRISDAEHREVFVSVSSNEYIKSLRKFSLANDPGLMEMNLAFDSPVVVPDRIVKSGQVSSSSPNRLRLPLPIPAHPISPGRNFGILGTSHRVGKSPYYDPLAVVPPKKYKSVNGRALSYSEISPCAEQLPMKSSIDDPLDNKTSASEVKTRRNVSPIFQGKHSQTNTGHVPLPLHKDLQASMKRATEGFPISGSKNLGVISHKAGNVDHGSDIIKIRLTSSLLNKAVKLFKEKPDPANLETAKSILKDQEKLLLDALVKLSEVSFATAYSVSNFQPAKFNQHDEETPKSVITSYEETAPKPVSSSSCEVPPSCGSSMTIGGRGNVMDQPSSSSCTSSIESRQAETESEVVKTKGAPEREMEPAAKRAWRPTAKLLGSEWFLSRKKSRRVGPVNV